MTLETTDKINPVDKEVSGPLYSEELKGLGSAALTSEAYYQKNDRSKSDLEPQQKMELAKEWLKAQDIEYERFEPIPPEIASEISILAQERYNFIDEDEDNNDDE